VSSLNDATNLDSLRGEVMKVTLEMVSLVSQRNALARQIGKEKARLGTSLVNLDVERGLRKAVLEHCKEIGIEPAIGQRLVTHLISESIRIQEMDSNPGISLDSHAVFVKAKEMEQAGRDVIHLEVGEPDFGPPEIVKKAVANAVSRGYTRYTQSVGIPELRQKIAVQISQQYQRKVSLEEVIVTVGGRYALFLGVAALIQPGEDAIIIDPSYPAYSSCIKEVGGRPIHVSTKMENGWVLDVDTVQELIGSSTKLLILNSPSNPTGKILDQSNFRELVALADENDIYIISDEVYADFSYTPHTSVLQYPDSKQITIKSFSKLFGMTGFRLGYAITDSETIKRMACIQKIQLTSVPEFIQHAGLAALDCIEDVKRHVATIKRRILTATKLLTRLPLSFTPPDGGLYIFLRMKTDAMNGSEIADRLLSKGGVCVMPGFVYGQHYNSFFRISVCQPEGQLVEAIGHIEEVLG
jgi:aspartate aminotransferase